jgi:hypothetical protein
MLQSERQKFGSTDVEERSHIDCVVGAGGQGGRLEGNAFHYLHEQFTKQDRKCPHSGKLLTIWRRVRRLTREWWHLYPRQPWWRYKVKQSLYRPGQALEFQEAEVLRFQDNRHMKMVRLSALRTGRHHHPGSTPVRGWVDPRATVRPEVLCQWKIVVTLSGMEPATFRLVAQCLNQLHHYVPHILRSITLFRKSCRLWDNMKKFCRVRRATDNIEHTHYMLET